MRSGSGWLRAHGASRAVDRRGDERRLQAGAKKESEKNTHINKAIILSVSLFETEKC